MTSLLRALARPASCLVVPVIALLAAAGGAAAQQEIAPSTRAVVVYTVSSLLPPGESGAAAQATLAERLGGDPSLASLTIDKSDHRATVQVVARFVFGSEEELRRWVTGDGGRLLAETLSRPAAQYGTRVEVRRFPAAGLLRLADGAVFTAVRADEVAPSGELARDRLLRALMLSPCPGAAMSAPIGRDLEAVAKSIDVSLESVERSLDASTPNR